MTRCPYCAEEIQDAAIVCRFCGRDVATSAPHAPTAHARHRQWREFALVLGLFALGGFAVVALNPTSNAVTVRPPVPAEAPRLEAELHFNGRVFTVKNPTKQEWRHVTVAIIGASAADTYTYVRPMMKPFDWIDVAATQFTNEDGFRFNPFTRKPHRVRIVATVDTGERRVFVGDLKPVEQ